MLVETVREELYCEVVVADFTWGSELCKNPTHFVTQGEERHAICLEHIRKTSEKTSEDYKIWCMCGPKCGKLATNTENAPNMNDYCDACTYERHDLPTENNPHR